MSAYDNYLLSAADGPEPLDEIEMQESICDVSDSMFVDGRGGELIQAVYDAAPAINHALREMEFPAHLREAIVALAKMAADIRAKVDDEYKVRTTTFDYARD